MNKGSYNKTELYCKLIESTIITFKTMPTGSKYSLPLNLKNDYRNEICLLTSQITGILLGVQNSSTKYSLD